MLKRDIDNFTGFIFQEEEKIFFHAQNNIFYFITGRVGILADILQKDLVAQDYFLYGYTSDGYQIALYTGYDRRKISTNYKLKPALYIVSKSNIKQYDMSTFQAVEFVGGTLNNLYEQKSINTRYDNSQQCFIKVYPEKRTVL